MSASDEKKIVKHYQHLIRALIPYEQENRLLEGLNKFSSRIPTQVRKVIKEEVIRLSSLTDAPADNSAFAQFPVFKFKHYGIQMCLDKIGTKILKKESALYQNRYTVGVFESVTSSDFYQSQMKKEQYEKIVDAFTIESQSLNDIQFGNDISIAPNFSVSSPDFQNGRNCSISSLGYHTMAVETRRPPKMSAGEEITFTFPEVMGFTQKETKLKFTLSNIKFNTHSSCYEVQFDLARDTDIKLVAQLHKYIDVAAYQQPLKREFEIERAMQDLERDRILENSPWIPVFARPGKKHYIPVIALLTKANVKHNDAFRLLKKFAGKSTFNKLMREAKKYGEAFLFYGTIKTKKGDVTIAATHRELASAGQLGSMIYLMLKAGDISCIQCRLDTVVPEDKETAFAIHDLAKTDYAELRSLAYVLFCKDVTQSVSHLTLAEKCPFPAISKSFIDDEQKWSIGYVMEEELDRRSETRYVIEKQASVKTGLLSALNATVKDISSSGMKIEIQDEVKNALIDTVKVSVPELRIKNERYQIISYDAQTRVLRLCLPQISKKGKPNCVDSLLEANSAFFRQRDVARTQRNTHRFIWELAVRHQPSVSILCVVNRHLLDRLKTVYKGDNADDLYPFSQVENVVPLHGFFADKATTRPKSKLLSDVMEGSVKSALVIHCVRKTDSRLVYLAEKDFLYGTLRQHVANNLQQDKVELCVTRIEAKKCQSPSTPLTKKRLAQLSKIDKVMYDKITGMQAAYTHVIYLTNEAALHNDLVRAKLRPLKLRTQSSQPSGAA